MSDTNLDFEKLEASRVLSVGEQQIVADWTEINRDLATARRERDKLNDEIKELVVERKRQARLVRVIDKSLLNGDTPDE